MNEKYTDKPSNEETFISAMNHFLDSYKDLNTDIKNDYKDLNIEVKNNYKDINEERKDFYHEQVKPTQEHLEAQYNLKEDYLRKELEYKQKLAEKDWELKKQKEEMELKAEKQKNDYQVKIDKAKNKNKIIIEIKRLFVYILWFFITGIVLFALGFEGNDSTTIFLIFIIPLIIARFKYSHIAASLFGGGLLGFLIGRATKKNSKEKEAD